VEGDAKPSLIAAEFTRLSMLIADRPGIHSTDYWNSTLVSANKALIFV
jgi:hypothetical protein